ncbi:Crp/Fnr family transcriptional regulator [Acidiphilium sp.]|uniref:Crp/Fnr family transcriptional regulator n=1 Tax=Acidiphilium sp. TaxID=527 RepID=UPI003D040172
MQDRNLSRVPGLPGPDSQFATIGGPAIQAIPLRGGDGEAHQLLSASDRRDLAMIASIRHIDAGAQLFEAGARAQAIFNIVSGVAKVSEDLADGRQATVAFFFVNDLLGMFESDHYIYTGTAVTPLTVYCLPVDALERLLLREPSLQMHFLCKLSHELRASQRQAIALRRYSAMQKMALFLDFMALHPEMQVDATGLMKIPMSRADIADYIGLTTESVSRALHRLCNEGIVELVTSHQFRIHDRARLDRLVGGDGAVSLFRQKGG